MSVSIGGMAERFDAARFATSQEQERWFENVTRTVVVDFDGVLHPYSGGWVGYIPADELPSPGAKEFLEQLNEAGFAVVVVSSRCDHDDGIKGIREWLNRYGLRALVSDVTSTKVPAVAYVDDRAVAYTGSFSESLAGVLALAGASPAHGPAVTDSTDTELWCIAARSDNRSPSPQFQGTRPSHRGMPKDTVVGFADGTKLITVYDSSATGAQERWSEMALAELAK